MSEPKRLDHNRWAVDKLINAFGVLLNSSQYSSSCGLTSLRSMGIPGSQSKQVSASPNPGNKGVSEEFNCLVFAGIMRFTVK